MACAAHAAAFKPRSKGTPAPERGAVADVLRADRARPSLSPPCPLRWAPYIRVVSAAGPLHLRNAGRLGSVRPPQRGPTRTETPRCDGPHGSRRPAERPGRVDGGGTVTVHALA